nr:MAG TPA: hypothetical protein [Caudoviricetes sp.]
MTLQRSTRFFIVRGSTLFILDFRFLVLAVNLIVSGKGFLLFGFWFILFLYCIYIITYL